jgi:hypothetical protein
MQKDFLFLFLYLILKYKVAWFRSKATYPRHHVKVPPLSECRTQARTTSHMQVLANKKTKSYIPSHNTYGSSADPEPSTSTYPTILPVVRRPSSLASNLMRIGLPRLPSSSSAPESESSLSTMLTGPRTREQRAAWSRHLQLPQHPPKCPGSEWQNGKGPRLEFVRQSMQASLPSRRTPRLWIRIALI